MVQYKNPTKEANGDLLIQKPLKNIPFYKTKLTNQLKFIRYTSLLTIRIYEKKGHLTKQILIFGLQLIWVERNQSFHERNSKDLLE